MPAGKNQSLNPEKQPGYAASGKYCSGGRFSLQIQPSLKVRKGWQSVEESAVTHIASKKFRKADSQLTDSASLKMCNSCGLKPEIFFQRAAMERILFAELGFGAFDVKRGISGSVSSPS